jgi:hypothetical protein
MLYSGGGNVAIETSEQTIFSDYYISSGRLYRLSNVKNYKVYFKPIIDQVYYTKVFEINETYDSLGLYKISASYLSTNIYVENVINIKNGKITN